MNRHLWGVVLVLCAMTSPLFSGVAHSQSVEEEYEPVVFNVQDRPLEIAADDRLESGSRGSIEIGLTLPPWILNNFPREMTIVSREGKDTSPFRVMITDFGQRIGLFDGNTYKSVKAVFTGGGNNAEALFFQIGFSTVGSQTHVFINGDPMGVIAIGYGRTGPRSVYIGGQASGQSPFQGEIDYMRLWRKALSREDYGRTFAEFGYPEDLPDLASDVMLYSQFTNQRIETYFTSTLGLADLLKVGSAGRVRRSKNLFIDVVPKDARLHSILMTGDEQINSFQLLVMDATGTIRPMPIRGRPADSADPRIHVFVVSEGDSLTGISGTVRSVTISQQSKTRGKKGRRSSGTVISSLMFHTSSGQTSEVFGNPETEGAREFQFEIPDGTTLGGLFGNADDHLASIGLAYDRPLLFHDVSGRWVLDEPDRALKSNSQQFERFGGAVPHGNYKTRQVYTLVPSHRGRQLNFRGDGANEVLQLQADGTYGKNADLKFFSDDEFEFRGTRFKKNIPRESLPADSEFAPVGGQFNLENMVPFYGLNYHGYDLTKVNPFNFQNLEGQQHPVFKKPSTTGRQYYLDDHLLKYVPSGMFYASDVMENSETQSMAIRTSQELTKAITRKVGISLNVPQVANIGLSRTLTKETRDSTGSEKHLVQTEEVQTTRALVLDPARVHLDPSFRNHMLALSLKRRAGAPIDYPAEVIAKYGTHYPYAVTLGTIAHNFIRYTKQARDHLKSEGKTIEGHASGTVKGVQGGGEGAKGKNQSNQIGEEMEEELKGLDQIGDRDKPVPVYMDLRRLDHLLDPVFFDEEIIWTTMRTELGTAIKDYVARKYREFDHRDKKLENPLAIYRFGMQLDKMVFTPTNITRTNKTGHVSRYYQIYGQLGFTDLNDTGIQLFYRDRDHAIRVKHFLGEENAVTLDQTEHTVQFTAQEICERSAVIAYGGTLKLLSNPTVGKKHDLEQIPQLIRIDPQKIGPSKKSFSQDFDFSRGPITATVSATAWQLPDQIDRSSFKEFPKCP